MDQTSENVRAQMRKGVLEYCIVVEGTLYPMLIRQKNQGLLSYRWEESPQGPPRKYYVITEKGRAQLSEMDAAWKEIVDTIETLKNE